MNIAYFTHKRKEKNERIKIFGLKVLSNDPIKNIYIDFIPFFFKCDLFDEKKM